MQPLRHMFIQLCEHASPLESKFNYSSAHELDPGLPKAHTVCMEAMSGTPLPSGNNGELATWREPDQLVSSSSLSRLGMRLARNPEAQRHSRCKQQVFLRQLYAFACEVCLSVG